MGFEKPYKPELLPRFCGTTKGFDVVGLFFRSSMQQLFPTGSELRELKGGGELSFPEVKEKVITLPTQPDGNSPRVFPRNSEERLISAAGTPPAVGTLQSVVC